MAIRSRQRGWLSALALLCALQAGPVQAESPGQTDGRGAAPLKVAVVGGLVLSTVWPRLKPLAEAATGLQIETVAAMPKEGIVPVFTRGEADLMLIHGSDETYALLATGLAAPLRAWGANQHVLVGPASDPAATRGSGPGAGAAAFARIAAQDAPLVGFRDPGSFAISHALWKAASRRPGPRQQLPDLAETPQDALGAAAKAQAYLIVGHIPVVFGRMPNSATDPLVVLVRDDPAMRRPYVVVEPGPRHPAGPAARAAAKTLADYLTGPAGQTDLTTLAQEDAARGGPWIFPLATLVAPTAAAAEPVTGQRGRRPGSGQGREHAQIPQTNSKGDQP